MRPRLSIEGGAVRLEGPLLFVRRTLEAGLNEAVEVSGSDGRTRLGRIAALDEQHMTIEVLESPDGLALADTVVRLRGTPLEFALGPGILGRVFNGIGEPVDGGPPLPARLLQPIDGLPVNPVERALPRDFIETGISAIDLMNSLVRGQKLPLFSCGGLPHDRIAVDIATHARLRGGSDDFAIVFAGIGVPFDSADFFRRSLEKSGALARTALFLNLASDSSTQRLLTPRFALTAAEYLAFDLDRHVLVVMTDMTNYAEALREGLIGGPRHLVVHIGQAQLAAEGRDRGDGIQPFVRAQQPAVIGLPREVLDERPVLRDQQSAGRRVPREPGPPIRPLEA